MSDSFTSSSDINENASLSSTDRREADNSGRESPPSDATLTSRFLIFFFPPHPECVCVGGGVSLSLTWVGHSAFGDELGE